MNDNEFETLKELAESVLLAIDSGDWKVDGRNDPELILDRVNRIMTRRGYTLDGLMGLEYVRD